MRIPYPVLLLQSLGVVLIGAALSRWLAGSESLLPLPHFAHDVPLFAAAGVLLSLPLSVHLLRRVRERDSLGEMSSGVSVASGRPTSWAERRAALIRASSVPLAESVAGERARHRCRPLARHYVRQAAAYGSVIMGALLAGLCAFGTWEAMTRFHAVTLAIPGVVLGFFGLYLLLAPLRLYRRARDIEYLVTDHGVHVLWRGRPQRRYPLEAFRSRHLRVVRHADGSANVTVPTVVRAPSNTPGNGYREQFDLGFYGIPDVDEFLAAARADS